MPARRRLRNSSPEMDYNPEDSMSSDFSSDSSSTSDGETNNATEYTINSEQDRDEIVEDPMNDSGNPDASDSSLSAFDMFSNVIDDFFWVRLNTILNQTVKIFIESIRYLSY